MQNPRAHLITAISGAMLILLAAAAVYFHGEGGEVFMPHAHCYLFNPKLMLLHGGSDLLIGLSYVAISATLTYLVFRARRELPFHWMMLAFALFIVACGCTHFMEVWTLRAADPRYWLSGWVKLLTATASVITAILLPPLVPKMRAVLESTRLANERKAELEKAYAELSALYIKETQQAPTTDGLAFPEFISRLEQTDHLKPQNLAQMAKEVTVHARELERAKHIAEAANQAKDQFLAVLSHELRTPLTPALAAASSLEHATEIDPRELRESLALIRRNIELEARLVDDLLDLTRISKGKLDIRLSTTDLHETLRHAQEMCRSFTNQKRSELLLQLDASHCHVSGDPSRLAQVFWNLMLNAVKFTPDNGRIIVRTINPTANTIRIEVEDNGIGMDPEMLNRIFEPFEQGEKSATRRYGGLGLGLSVAKGLVDAHGGTLIASSEGRDRGAKFTIDLATVQAPEAAPTLAAPAPAPARQHSLRILVAEDHADTRRVLEQLLKRWGHEVKSAPTVAESLEIAATFHPDLLLSDIGLPDGTGMELLGRLRLERDIPAVAMSGYGMDSDLEQTKQAGFKEHLIKPVSAMRLKEVIEHITASLHPAD